MISAAGGKPSSRHPIPQDTQAHGAVRERESLPREEYRRRRRLFFSLLDGKARRPYNRDTILSGPPSDRSLGARGKPSDGRGAPERRAHGREEAPARGGPKRRRSRPRKRKEGQPSFFRLLLDGILLPRYHIFIRILQGGSSPDGPRPEPVTLIRRIWRPGKPSEREAFSVLLDEGPSLCHNILSGADGGFESRPRKGDSA